uniref:Uncharacterized protein n=1 Tax=Candidatus Kentrum sp. LFY TaxID=2126342 RepID=A0A450USQ1_9GAMM|nr:MAG: hypothetical protein BECKLFY1418B_GA0070995_107110 [Candidatus Kentron sp. LFY]
MNIKKYIGFGLVAIGSLLATSGFAAPMIHLENAQLIATGDKIQVFRVPTVDVDKKVKYHDLTIELGVLDDGAIDVSAADIKTAVSPNFASNKFISGSYTDLSKKVACTVSAVALPGGRAGGSLSCKDKRGWIFQANWVGGPVSGHPIEPDLKAAGIDKLGSTSDYSWGKIGHIDAHHPSWSCRQNDIIRVMQVGNTVAVAGYRGGNKQVCGFNVVKKEHSRKEDAEP